MRFAIYVRVSTVDQHTENQLPDLEAHVKARKGTIVKVYRDHGVSGSLEKRPALDAMLRDARKRKFDCVVVWKLDRLGRSLRHLLNTLHELATMDIAFVSIDQGIDTSTAAGRLQLHLLSAIAEFERSQTSERVRAGLARVKANGTQLGRPRTPALEKLDTVNGLSHSKAAQKLGVCVSTVVRWRRERREAIAKTPLGAGSVSPGFAGDLGSADRQ